MLVTTPKSHFAEVRGGYVSHDRNSLCCRLSPSGSARRFKLLVRIFLARLALAGDFPECSSRSKRSTGAQIILRCFGRAAREASPLLHRASNALEQDEP